MGFVVDNVKVKENQNALLSKLNCGCYNKIWSWKSEKGGGGGGGGKERLFCTLYFLFLRKILVSFSYEEG